MHRRTPASGAREEPRFWTRRVGVADFQAILSARRARQRRDRVSDLSHARRDDLRCAPTRRGAMDEAGAWRRAPWRCRQADRGARGAHARPRAFDKLPAERNGPRAREDQDNARSGERAAGRAEAKQQREARRGAIRRDRERMTGQGRTGPARKQGRPGRGSPRTRGRGRQRSTARQGYNAVLRNRLWSNVPSRSGAFRTGWMQRRAPASRSRR
jgi:hypothetical protein